MLRIAIAFAMLVALSPAAQADPHWGHGGGGWGWHGGGGWNPWHRDDDGGANVLGGIIGGALGSYLWGQTQPAMPTPIAIPVPELQPFTPPWFDYCAQRYRTFDAHTGYYTGFDGRPHFCQ